jgi:hypothetical protein
LQYEFETCLDQLFLSYLNQYFPVDTRFGAMGSFKDNDFLGSREKLADGKLGQYAWKSYATTFSGIEILQIIAHELL